VIDYSKLQQWALDMADGDRAAAVNFIVDAVESAAINGDTVAIQALRVADVDQGGHQGWRSPGSRNR
jgi:hypothetical protein